MIDRHGNPITVAYSEGELIYLRAANTLDIHDRACAIRDISEMTGREPHKVRRKADDLRAADNYERRRPRDVPKPVQVVSTPVGYVDSGFISRPSRAALMGCKARPAKATLSVAGE